jgi:hypothetical protein
MYICIHTNDSIKIASFHTHKHTSTVTFSTSQQQMIIFFNRVTKKRVAIHSKKFKTFRTISRYKILYISPIKRHIAEKEYPFQVQTES